MLAESTFREIGGQLAVRRRRLGIMRRNVVAWHQVAHAASGTQPLGNADNARWLWLRLRACCGRGQDHGSRGRSACAVLMPDHVHLVHFGNAQRTRLALIKLVAALVRFRGTKPGWQVPAPEPIARDKVWRQLRYVHLNPCRAGLARDPLSWTFSTHRDSVGATYDPWLCLGELPVPWHGVRALPLPELRERFHAYVSADPSVHPEGTAFPAPAPPRCDALLGLEQIRRAALAASPWCAAARQRERVVRLAQHQGWFAAEAIAQAVGVTRRQVYRIWRRGPVDLAPAALCLGDARLRER
jgi:hypothetical protein